MEELTIFKNKERINLSDVFTNNKPFIFPILFYLAGLFIGAIFYGVVDDSTLKAIIEEIAKGSSANFLQLFLNKLTVYLSVYTACVLLGLCLVGFPFINVVPLVCGIEIALKLSYYYVTYGIKGVGYSFLIIVPGAVCFITLLIYTISLSNTLSKTIYHLTTKKADIIEEINLKSYLLRFFIYALLVVGISALSALLTYLLSSIVTL